MDGPTPDYETPGDKQFPWWWIVIGLLFVVFFVVPAVIYGLIMYGLHLME